MPKRSLQQFILLPTRGLSAPALAPSSADQRNFLLSVEGLRPAAGPVRLAQPGAPPNLQIRVVDSIHEDGAKLVELPPEAIPALRTFQPGLRLVPLVYFRPAVSRVSVQSGPRATATGVGVSITVSVVSKADGSPVAGATVVAFTDFENRIGAQGQTRSDGSVSLALGASSRTIERLYIYPKAGFWSGLSRSLVLRSGQEYGLAPIDLSFTDCLRFFYGNSPDGAGQGVTVGVIDTGIDGSHPDLTVNGGENTVPGEDPTDWGDNGAHHGTHVAGIVAAHGNPPTGIRGLAPAVTLRSYRVFPQGQEQASNYAIAKAIDRATADGCDLINMSLGGGPADEATSAAIEDARDGGVAVIVAAGNDDRSPVSFPASDSLSVAVSATGRKGTFPRGTTDRGDVKAPYGTDRNAFIAAFSNVGPEIDVTGPGVGVLSTVPGGAYAPMSGTSMACPSVTGAAARLLAARPDILAMPRDQARSDAITQALLQSARPLGFGPTYEGQGLPQ
jgi:subtilisin family serine protease